MLPARRQDHPDLARKVLLLSPMRPTFPSMFWGRERDFEAGNIIAATGEKHRSLRAGWQPMFYSGRCGWQVLRDSLRGQGLARAATKHSSFPAGVVFQGTWGCFKA